jgi:putative glutamine amidotransferase
MIRIGVSACFMYPDPTRTVFGHKTLAYFEQDMAKFLSRKGVMPIFLPDLPWSELDQYLQEMDGFVFQGGADIAPSTYGEEAIENSRWPGDRFRDQYELKIFDYAIKNQRPIFAICRGFQLANIYFGGKLYQDLVLQTSTTVEHRNAQQYDRIFHQVQVTDGSLLERIYKNKILTVNSVHHQGVEKLGQGLVVDAFCPKDNLIEAFHHSHLPVFGVQWHPEFSATLNGIVEDPEPYYDHFLKVVEKFKR